MKHFTHKADWMFTKLGSKFIDFVVQNEAFVMICKSEGGVFHEAIRTKIFPETDTIKKYGDSWENGPPIIVETTVLKNRTRMFSFHKITNVFRKF